MKFPSSCWTVYYCSQLPKLKFKSTLHLKQNNVSGIFLRKETIAISFIILAEDAVNDDMPSKIREVAQNNLKNSMFSPF